MVRVFFGATDNSDLIAYLSKRGPVTVDDSHRPKPDVSATSVAVRSSLPGGGYGYKDKKRSDEHEPDHTTL